MSLALLQAYADSGDEDAPGWNGGVPADAHEWCSGLHNLISAIYGDAQDTGVEPYWYTQCDDEFIEDEEHRRGLPIGTLKPFLNLPYDHNVTVSEVNSGKKATAVGYLLGTGEKFDKWDCLPAILSKAWRRRSVTLLATGADSQRGRVAVSCGGHSCSHPSWNKGGWHSGEWQDAELLLRPHQVWRCFRICVTAALVVQNSIYYLAWIGP